MPFSKYVQDFLCDPHGILSGNLLCKDSLDAVKIETNKKSNQKKIHKQNPAKLIYKPGKPKLIYKTGKPKTPYIQKSTPTSTL